MSRFFLLVLSAIVIVVVSGIPAETLVSADVRARRKSQSANGRFVECVAKNNLECVRRALENGMNPNVRDQKDKEMSTVAMIAAMAGNTDMLSLLISAGADVNATTTKGRTALMWAAWRGRNESAKTLIEKNAIVNAQDGFGSTALMLAAHMGQKDLVVTLLDAGADVNLRASDSSTALIAAVRGERSEIVKLLLSRSANANIVENIGRTPLILAIENGDIESITALLKNRVNVDLRDRRGETALTLATKQNNAPVVDLILNTAVVDVNVPDSLGTTPLMVAAEQGDTNTAKSLMEKGANIEAEDAQGRTAFFRAKLARQTQTMALLTAEGARTTSNQWPY